MFDYTCAVILYEMCIQDSVATVSHTENHLLEHNGNSR